MKELLNWIKTNYKVVVAHTVTAAVLTTVAVIEPALMGLLTLFMREMGEAEVEVKKQQGADIALNEKKYTLACAKYVVTTPKVAAQWLLPGLVIFGAAKFFFGV